jgi:hypothetical protein
MGTMSIKELRFRADRYLIRLKIDGEPRTADVAEPDMPRVVRSNVTLIAVPGVAARIEILAFCSRTYMPGLQYPATRRQGQTPCPGTLRRTHEVFLNRESLGDRP